MKCWELVKGADVIALQGTHTIATNTARLITGHDHTFWWSHETRQTGSRYRSGEQLPETFPHPEQGRSVEGVVQGRAAILRLDGSNGPLDIIAV